MVRLYTSGLGPFFHKHSPRPIEAGGVAWAGSETAHALVGRHWNEQRAGEIMGRAHVWVSKSKSTRKARHDLMSLK